MIWLIAVLGAALLFGWGYLRGFIQMIVSAIGFLVWLLVWLPALKELPTIPDAIIPKVMYHEIMLPFLAGFLLLINGLFFMVAGIVISVIYHRKLRYRGDDATVQMFVRLNRRLGAVVGVYLAIICTVLLASLFHGTGYFINQVPMLAQAGGLPGYIDRFRVSMHTSGLDRLSAIIDDNPDSYYEFADLAGLLHANPLLLNRIINYPPFLKWIDKVSVEELFNEGMDEFDDALVELEIGGYLDADELVGIDELVALMSDPVSRAFLASMTLLLVKPDVLDILVNEPDMEDFVDYLTGDGRSKKYSDRILGRWEFNPNASINKLKREKTGIDIKALSLGFISGEENIRIKSREFLQFRHIANSAMTGARLTFYTDNTWRLDYPRMKEPEPEREPDPRDLDDPYGVGDDPYGGLGFGPPGAPSGGLAPQPERRPPAVTNPYQVIEGMGSEGAWRRIAPGRYELKGDVQEMKAVIDTEKNRLEVRDYLFPYIRNLQITDSGVELDGTPEVLLVPVDMLFSRIY